MKSPTFLALHRLARLAFLISSPIAASLPAATVDSQEPSLVINVRTEVDRPFEGLGKAELKEHGKVYAITSIEEEKSEWKLLFPVNEEGMLKTLRAELTKHGFKETTPGLKPDILITVNYGRGGLVNPYLNTAPTKYLKSYEMDFATKLQNANEEKLFIRITAWAFPEIISGQKIVPRQLWKTIMMTDSPEDRDMNQFYPKMLAAGSGFFDRELETVEAEIHDDLPEGHVTVGEIKVLKQGDPDLPTSPEEKKEKK